MNTRCKKGLTLIELIIAISILGIVFVSFLNLFNFGLLGLFRAGHKSESFNMVQKRIESQLGRDEENYSDRIELTFGDEIIEITGTFFNESTVIGLSSSELSGFIPFIPTINLNPKASVEGTNVPILVEVIGHKTNFNSSTRVEIWNHEFTSKLYDLTFTRGLDDAATADINESKITGSFQIDSNLFNSKGDYIVRIITNLHNGTQEISRAKYTVTMPMIVIVGEDALYVSENGDSWVDRTLESGFPYFNQLMDVVYAKSEYHAVGMGDYLIAKSFQPWVRKSILGASNISGLSHINGNYFLSTEGGEIYHSSDGTTWSSIFNDGTIKFNDIHSTGDGKVIAVGDGVIVTRDTDGTFIKSEDIFTDISFNGITSKSVYNEDGDSWSHTYAVVGSNGRIFRSIDGIAWTSTESGVVNNLNSVFNTSNKVDFSGPEWLVVGDSGTFLGSSDLESWNTITAGTSAHLNDVFVSQKRVFVVGNNGTILRSGENNLNFTIMNVGTKDLKAITGRQ